MIKWVHILYIYIYIYICLLDFWWYKHLMMQFFWSQAKKLDLSSSLSLILSSSLAWLINQAKPSRAELKLFGILTSSSSNIVFRLVSSSSQAWAFDFYWQAKLKHVLFGKTWLVYRPTYMMIDELRSDGFEQIISGTGGCANRFLPKLVEIINIQ